jgi:manganese transport protein
VIPLVKFTRDRAKMGALASPQWLTWTAWAMTVLIIVLNVKLIYDSALAFLL